MQRFWGNDFVTDVKTNKNNIPTKFSLLQNYPNPFNSQSNTILILPVTSNVEVTIFNSLGESVQFFNKVLSAGGNVISITNSNLVSGIYYYSIRVSNSHLNEFSTGKLIYIK